MKTRSIKTKKRLVSYKTVINIKLQFTGNGFLPVYTEKTPESEKNEKIGEKKNKIK